MVFVVVVVGLVFVAVVVSYRDAASCWNLASFIFKLLSGPVIWCNPGTWRKETHLYLILCPCGAGYCKVRLLCAQS